MNARILMAALLILISTQLKAQNGFDTLRVMTYNLLYYGETTSFCTSTNNPLADKDGYFKAIAKYVKPDLLVVNEMAANSIYQERILAKVLNVDGVNDYNKVALQTNGFQDIANGIFYNKKKFALHEKVKLTQNQNGSSIVRAIDVITLYYRDPFLLQGSDTTFVHLIAAHLKAGNTSSDAVDRGLAAETVMNYIKTNLQPGYFMMCGDLNLYTSSEDAFQELTSSTHGAYRLMDPMSETGNWNNNSSFADVHTQSTHTSGSCFSGGGLDDRFDFILMSEQMLQDTGNVSYIADSYWAVGQDGNHFNQAINQGGNSSVNSTVLLSLYNMSDHLPVIADFRVKLLPEPDTAESVAEISSLNEVKIWSQGGEIRIDNKLQKLEVEMYDLSGRLIDVFTISHGYQAIAEPKVSGVYLLKISTGKAVYSHKMLIAH